MELAAVVDCGGNFVKATYKLESDGPVVFKRYEIISTLTASIHTAHFPNLSAVAQKLTVC